MFNKGRLVKGNKYKSKSKNKKLKGLLIKNIKTN